MFAQRMSRLPRTRSGWRLGMATSTICQPRQRVHQSTLRPGPHSDWWQPKTSSTVPPRRGTPKAEGTGGRAQIARGRMQTRRQARVVSLTKAEHARKAPHQYQHHVGASPCWYTAQPIAYLRKRLQAPLPLGRRFDSALASGAANPSCVSGGYGRRPCACGRDQPLNSGWRRSRRAGSGPSRHGSHASCAQPLGV